MMWNVREWVQDFNPSTWEAAAGESEFKASLVYKASSKIARAAQRNPVSNEQTNTQTRIDVEGPLHCGQDQRWAGGPELQRKPD